MSQATQSEIDNFFDTRWGLYKADLERVLNALDGNGAGSNFASAILVLAAMEQFAKVYSPTSMRRGENRFRTVRIRQERFDDIQAKHSVKLFFNKYMSPIDARYSTYGPWIWDVFRNGLTHLFFSKKITDVPLQQIENSFLTGVHWPGPLNDIQNNPGLLNTVRQENMSFNIAGNVRGIPRPVFRIVPHIFYLDLVQATIQFKHDIETIPYRKKMFTNGIRLMDRARRKPFIHNDLPQNVRRQMVREIRNLI